MISLLGAVVGLALTLLIVCICLFCVVIQEQDTVDKYGEAIRWHRDQHGDDRCWMDDEVLYEVLPEGYTPPERSTSVELELCKQYIGCRHNPRTVYVSPEREIERLNVVNGNLNREAAEYAIIIKEHLTTIRHLQEQLATITREDEDDDV